MANKRKAMEEVPAPFTVDGTESSNSTEVIPMFTILLVKQGSTVSTLNLKSSFLIKGNMQVNQLSQSI